MIEQTIPFDGKQIREEAMEMAAPLQAAWRKAYLELPLTILSESLRFFGQRLQAQGEFIASLTSCKTMPDVMEAQSQFMRTAVTDYGAETTKIMEDVRSSVSKAA